MTTEVIVTLPDGDSKAAQFIRTMLVTGVARHIAHQFLTLECFVDGTDEEQQEAARCQFADQVAERLLNGRAVVTMDHWKSPRFYSVADKLIL